MAVPDFGSGTFAKSGRNPAPVKIPPEPDSFARFEKVDFSQALDNLEL